MTAIYSLDTSAILGMFQRRFPPDVVPSFWAKFEPLVARGHVVCIQQVHDEVKQQSDDAEAWLAERAAIVRPMTASVLQRTQTIVRAHYPADQLTSKRSFADPFVIALAMEEGLTVVSDEQPAASARIPKIPNLCQTLGVPHVDVFGLARQQGWRF